MANITDYYISILAYHRYIGIGLLLSAMCRIEISIC